MIHTRRAFYKITNFETGEQSGERFAKVALLRHIVPFYRGDFDAPSAISAVAQDVDMMRAMFLEGSTVHVEVIECDDHPVELFRHFALLVNLKYETHSTIVTVDAVEPHTSSERVESYVTEKVVETKRTEQAQGEGVAGRTSTFEEEEKQRRG